MIVLAVLTKQTREETKMTTHKTVKIDDEVEINIPIKTLISVISVIVVVAWYVFVTEEKINDVEREVKMLEEKFENHNKQPEKDQGQIDMLNLRIQNLTKDVEALEKNKGN